MPDPVVPCPDVPPELARHPKYLVLRELGRGGMGVVYQARQTVMDRPVVIKVINPLLLAQPGALERFRREVQAAARLSHPNIVTAYDAEQVGALHMLVMEFVPGQSLAEVLEKQGPLPVTKACQYARQAALGLQHAHERGMVHRDIKPSNLMLTPRGQVKVLDFGLAKVAREGGTGTGLTASGSYVGTPDYSAPEQARDARSADIRADLYSLGCTLYCLLAGRPPFQEDTPVATILAHHQKEPQPLPELRPDVPERLWRVVARLLAKDPPRRYQKPIEVVHALAPFIKTEVKAGSPPPLPVSSPGKGTVIAEVSDEKQAAPLANLTETPASRLEVRRARRAAKPSPAWWKRPGVLAAALGLSLGLTVIAVILSQDNVRTPDSKVATTQRPPPAEATIVVEIDEPGAEVWVDGQNSGVNIPGGGNAIEVKVEPGRHRVEVKKDGFDAYRKVVSLENGGRQIITARLEKMQERHPAGGFSPPGGGGDAPKPAALTPREKRMLRWRMCFNTETGADYLAQLRGLGAILAIPVNETPSGREYKIVRDLSKRPAQLLDEDVSKIQRIYWIEDNPQSVRELMGALGFNIMPSHLVAFVPEELENKLFELEKAKAGGRPEDDIRETKFRVKRMGGRYEVELTEITFK